MGRAAKYAEQDILDAALALVVEEGPQSASVVAIAARLNAPSGSIYHRFASRDLILATVWVRAVRRFQQGFLDALAIPEPREAAQQAVHHTLQWTAQHPVEAKVLAMHRRQDLIASWPTELGEELSSLNSAVTKAVVGFAVRHFGTPDRESIEKARFALIDIPHVAVRHSLGDQQPPWLRDTALAACLAALGLTPDPS
ncbi:TetR/AcrR family transcriptional regulator [Ornithinimicrobium ciconiae]|uniref:TetR/AcrR family transcriptional regulator n=1 Tax=Ornithinimicrobium ciconiae TaxID=2594265 RepID=UPI0013FD01A7|nr:TetR/AcrR family transcriptional regulator [Ornithinimicrobium ciconiae]